MMKWKNINWKKNQKRKEKEKKEKRSTIQINSILWGGVQ